MKKSGLLLVVLMLMLCFPFTVSAQKLRYVLIKSIDENGIEFAENSAHYITLSNNNTLIKGDILNFVNKASMAHGRNMFDGWILSDGIGFLYEKTENGYYIYKWFNGRLNCFYPYLFLIMSPDFKLFNVVLLYSGSERQNQRLVYERQDAPNHETLIR